MQAIKKQWFTLLLMIIQAVMIIFIQPEIGSVSLCNLMFIAIFADDERNVFLKLAWEDKFYFYVQCIVMYLMTLIFGLILALDHGSGSITVTTKAFNALQMINIILRFIMTRTPNLAARQMAFSMISIPRSLIFGSCEPNGYFR